MNYGGVFLGFFNHLIWHSQEMNLKGMTMTSKPSLRLSHVISILCMLLEQHWFAWVYSQL